MVKRRMTRGDAGAGGTSHKADTAKPQAAAGKVAEAPATKVAAMPGTKPAVTKPPAAGKAAAKPVPVQAALNQSVSKPALARDAQTSATNTALMTPAPVKPHVAPDAAKASAKEPIKPVAAKVPLPAKAPPEEAKAPAKPPETKHAAPAPIAAKSAEAPKPEPKMPEPVKPEPAKPAAAKPAEAKAPEVKPVEAKVPEPKPVETKPAPAPEPATTAKPAAPALATPPSEPAPKPSTPEAAKPVDAKPAQAKPVEAKAAEAKPVPPAPAAAKPVPVAAMLPVAANTDHPAAKLADGPLRLHLSTQALDIGGIGDTVVGYLRSEGAAALAHLKALGTAKSPADMIRLQVGEMQRVADASLTVWSELARKASRAVDLRR